MGWIVRNGTNKICQLCNERTKVDETEVVFEYTVNDHTYQQAVHLDCLTKQVQNKRSDLKTITDEHSYMTNMNRDKSETINDIDVFMVEYETKGKAQPTRVEEVTGEKLKEMIANPKCVIVQYKQKPI